MALNSDRFSSRVAGACREPAEGSALEPPGPRTGCGAGRGASRLLVSPWKLAYL